MRSVLVKLFFLLVLPLTVPTFDLFLAHYRWEKFIACTNGTTPSNFTFGYGELRPGAVESCLSSANFSGFAAEKLKIEFPTPAMLLYWNGLKEDFAPFRGRRVLIGQGYPASVYAFDLDKKEILWRHNFFEPKTAGKNTMPINSSAPVIDPKNHRIYGTYIEENFHGKKATDSRLTQHYYSIGLDGREPEQRTVDLAEILLEKGTVASADDIHKYVRCRTALGLNLAAEHPYVYSGCSIVRAFSFLGSQFVHEASLQQTKGIRGVLLALPLAPDGHFDRKAEIRRFIPSKLGAIPEAGVDAGIWHSGGAPTLFPGNRMVFATGNGVFRPDLGVYGCAVLRLDGNRLELDGENSTYFSPKGQDIETAGHACHGSNLDPSSSSVATVEKDGRYFSVIGGKDGWLKSFDPLRLPGSAPDPAAETQVTDGQIFGQPVIFPSRRNAALTAVGGNGSDGLHWNGYGVASSRKLKKIWSLSWPFPRAFNSSAAGTFTEKGESPLLFIPLRATADEHSFDSSLDVVDAETGRILAEHLFVGNSHFSMPTVVDDRIFVPTAEHGIQMFSAKRSFHEFLQHHSWTGRYIARFVSW